MSYHEWGRFCGCPHNKSGTNWVHMRCPSFWETPLVRVGAKLWRGSGGTVECHGIRAMVLIRRNHHTISMPLKDISTPTKPMFSRNLAHSRQTHSRTIACLQVQLSTAASNSGSGSSPRRGESVEGLNKACKRVASACIPGIEVVSNMEGLYKIEQGSLRLHTRYMRLLSPLDNSPPVMTLDRGKSLASNG